MSNYILKSAWKKKMEIINIFDEKFLNEKDIALQPITFILETSNNLISNNLKNKNLPSNNNTESVKSIKSKNEEKDKSPKINKKNTSKKKKSIRNSGLYSSNIVIVQSITDGDNDGESSFNIEREVQKIKRMMTKSKSKKNKKKISLPKGLKGSNSAKF